MRISELRDLRDYSQRDATTAPRPHSVARDVVPNAAATAALTRRSYSGLAFTEVGTPRRRDEALGGLGELVQVVT